MNTNKYDDIRYGSLCGKLASIKQLLREHHKILTLDDKTEIKTMIFDVLTHTEKKILERRKDALKH